MGDEQHMERALALALKGKGSTSPNPMVGAVLVRDGQTIGEGWHQRAGEPHAEVEAIRKAEERSRGATLYVNLEPCVHFGKTPPCTDLIIQKGIQRVVCAMEDPNPSVAGKGLAKLRASDIEVVCGVLEEQAAQLNEVYLKYMRTGLPFVTLKLAQSLDGRIATKTGDSRWITGDAAREWVHQLRSEVDAVLVGTNTVLADDPQLTARGVEGRSPVKIVLDSRLRIPASAKVFSGGRTILVTRANTAAAHKGELEKRQVETWILPDFQGPNGVRQVLLRAGKEKLTSLLVEGGAQLAASLLRGGLVDRLAVLIAPTIIGEGVGSVADLGIEEVADALPLEDVETQRLGDDMLYLCRLARRNEGAAGSACE